MRGGTTNVAAQSSTGQHGTVHGQVRLHHRYVCSRVVRTRPVREGPVRRVLVATSCSEPARSSNHRRDHQNERPSLGPVRWLKVAEPGMQRR